MRPDILFPLFRPLDSLPGIGLKTAQILPRLLGGEQVVHLLWHAPTGVVDRTYQPKISELVADKVATLRITVDIHHPPQKSHQPWRVLCHDETGQIELVFFHPRKTWLEQQLPVGAERIVSGRAEYYSHRWQIVHPDHIAAPEHLHLIAKMEPVYPMTAGLATKTLQRAIAAALETAPDLPEWLEPALLARENWPGWKQALLALHHPENTAMLDIQGAIRRRLAYDELLSNQLALALLRRHYTTRKGRELSGDQSLQTPLLASLPFTLTGAQQRAIAEIKADMAKPERMMRLLQGDVGSGKTLVALMAMLNAVEVGVQTVLMAPTEILVRQHAQSLAPYLEAIGVEMVVLTGRDTGRQRTEILAQIAEGSAKIVLGTHALFQKGVDFANLGFAVIDEQHRFGVHQRIALSEKGRRVDVLVMTATPIPRTLTLTAYGDMEVSQLDEKPPGRQPIETRIIPVTRWKEVAEAIRRKIAEREQAYWVCPLVEESRAVDLAAAEARHASLRELFGDRVGLVHGRMKAEEKESVMQRFAARELDVLVATTVIEVGVDVPSATIMVIEHAERFGLAQLHQLRGRVGRGVGASSCLLLYTAPLGDTARARLEILRATEDGFLIAEKDLELRGAGEILGTRQSGLPQCVIADLEAHGALLQMARKDAELILQRDPDLQTPRGQALRTLLYLFARDEAVKYLASG